MDGQNVAFLGLFLKALVIAVGAVTGVLGVLLAVSVGMLIARLVVKGVSKAGGIFKREPKQAANQPQPVNHP